MDPLQAAVAAVTVERHPLEPPSPHADSETASPLASAAADDFFAGAAPPLCAAPGAQLAGLPLLRALARQGTWRAVAERAKETLAKPGLPRDQALSCITFHALALAKLRMYGGAADALRAAGDPDAPPNLGPDGRSLAPFALRWLQAQLPVHLGAPGSTLDALCTLYASCSAARDAAKAAGDAAAAATAARRADITLHAVVCFQAMRRDWRAALAWLDAASRAAPGDPAPLAAAGLVLLQLGDAAGAAAATDAAEAACAAAEATAGAPALVETARAAVVRNRAMLRFAAKDYAGARDAFEAALAARPWDGVAANNAATARLYCADLPGAVALLEHTLAAHPLAALAEPLVLNLCSLYELAAADAPAAKRRLAEWLAKAGPECFDGAATRL